jgi:DNA repair protein SbcD/Mre11
MTLRLLHFADLHLGVENYGRLDPATGLNSRVADFAACLAFTFDTAIEQKVDLVLFAGDAYKTCDPSPTFQREFASQLRRLQQARIPVVLVVGNHDIPAAFGKATSLDIFAALELDNTYVIRRPDLLRIDTPSGPVQIAGLPWPTRHWLRTRDEYSELGHGQLNEKIAAICDEQIDSFARDLDPQTPAVLTAHITAAEAVFSGSERTAIIGQDPTLLTGALAHPAFDYVALGHVHRHQDLHAQAPPSVVYSGSIERIDFGEEDDEKGFCLVNIETTPQGRKTNINFVPTPARRFTTVTAKIDPETEDPTQNLLDAIDGAHIDDAVVRVYYEVPVGASPRIDLERVQQALEAAHFVAGIHPRLAPRVRQRRVEVTEDLGIHDALDRYIENRPDLHGQRQVLLQRAAELENELDASAGPSL